MTRNRLLIIGGAIVALWIALNLALHFGQIRHNQLDYDIAEHFPPGKPTAPGEIFASTLAAIVDHELHTAFGWRPNDFFLWGPKVGPDNNADRQLGIIQAVRETTRIFKDNLTKVSSNQYDQNLVIADTDFRNDALKWILPAPEGKYADGVAHLRLYVTGLRDNPPTSRELNVRAVELIRLVQAWTDLLGDAHANLYRSKKDDGSAVHTWDCDHYFYHAQGYAHVMFHMIEAIEREYVVTFKDDPILKTMFDETEDALGKAAVLKPLVVMNGSPAGLFANHRRNLDAYISEARQKMYSIREELQRSPL
ncbi:MAG: DUF2333 family protein [Candidatus Binatus sp.]|uniref:DUF2333 family protein n=1 Tax=Candidatus Binatus sp. TaxID=2811406 RepID=UPI002718A878|nr:DUF2333 family protein [Candidatus Binatus sp.]MDO8434225.1 DUF2333 family protein [Candidatus Binatus sp.]